MAQIYDKPVRALMKDMVADMGLKRAEILSRTDVKAWFKERYPKIKDGTISCHLLRFSTNAPSRIHYNASATGDDDVFYQIDGARFRLFNPDKDPSPIYPESGPDGPGPDPPEEGAEFAYEKDLQNFLVKNLELIEPGLWLFEDEEVKGVEFPVGGRFVDILAVDENDNLVVIELKVSRGYDRVVGQILRYMAWIRDNQADSGQSVRGIIVARKISEDLVLACSSLSGVELFEYELAIKLKKLDS